MLANFGKSVRASIASVAGRKSGASGTMSAAALNLREPLIDPTVLYDNADRTVVDKMTARSLDPLAQLADTRARARAVEEGYRAPFPAPSPGPVRPQGSLTKDMTPLKGYRRRASGSPSAGWGPFVSAAPSARGGLTRETSLLPVSRPARYSESPRSERRPSVSAAPRRKIGSTFGAFGASVMAQLPWPGRSSRPGAASAERRRPRQNEHLYDLTQLAQWTPLHDAAPSLLRRNPVTADVGMVTPPDPSRPRRRPTADAGHPISRRPTQANTAMSAAALRTALLKRSPQTVPPFVHGAECVHTLRRLPGGRIVTIRDCDPRGVRDPVVVSTRRASLRPSTNRSSRASGKTAGSRSSRTSSRASSKSSRATSRRSASGRRALSSGRGSRP